MKPIRDDLKECDATGCGYSDPSAEDDSGELTLDPIVYRVNGHQLKCGSIFIQVRSNNTWTCTNGFQEGECLNTMGKFEYEPLPSNRTDEFIARTRFPCKEDALANLKLHLPKSRLERTLRRKEA